jgi:peroxin-13
MNSEMSRGTSTRPSPLKPWETTGNNNDNDASVTPVSNVPSSASIPTPQRPLPNNPSMIPYYGASVYGTTSSYVPRFSSYHQPYHGHTSYTPSTYGYRSVYGGGYEPNTTMMMDGNSTIPGSMSLSRHMETSSREAFRLIDTVVQAVGGFAQMLDSTFYATYSSFMAMVSMAEQFGHMRQYLTSMFSIFVLYRNLKRLFYMYILRRKPPLALDKVVPSEFQKFELEHSDETRKTPRISRTPVLLFLAATFGVPYLLSKFIKLFQSIEERRQREYYEKIRNEWPQEFAVALHDFEPQMELDLPLKAGSHIRILMRTDPATGQPVQWWKAECEGRVGYVPCNYVRLLEPHEMTTL